MIRCYNVYIKEMKGIDNMEKLMDLVEMLVNEMKENRVIIDNHNLPLKERMVAINKYNKAEERLNYINNRLDELLK